MQSTPTKPKRNKPVGVTIVAIIAAAGGVLSLLGGLMVLSGMASGPTALAVIVLVFGFLGLGVGAVLLMGKPWAGMFAIVVYVVSIPLGIAEILYGGNIGGIGGIIRVVAGIVIPVYLTRSGPKAYFLKK